jgi:hypothetical protein
MYSARSLVTLVAAALGLTACGSPASPSTPEAAPAPPASEPPAAAAPAASPAAAPSVTGPNDSQMCVAARAARARNSPTAANLAKQCQAAGGTP